MDNLQSFILQWHLLEGIKGESFPRKLWFRKCGVGERGGTSTNTNQYCLSGEEHFEAYKEMFGAENVEWTSRDTLSSADRLRIQDWAYPPTDELYLKYKDVYQNDLYFN